MLRCRRRMLWRPKKTSVPKSPLTLPRLFANSKRNGLVLRRWLSSKSLRKNWRKSRRSRRSSRKKKKWTKKRRRKRMRRSLRKNRCSRKSKIKNPKT